MHRNLENIDELKNKIKEEIAIILVPLEVINK
jgi:hypothetical protein